MKNTNNQVVTRGILKEELKKESTLFRKEFKEDLMLTKQDLKKELTLFRKEFKEDLMLTKQDLKEELATLREYTDKRFDSVMDLLDYLVKNLNDLIADNAAHMALYNRVENNHLNHEGRIIKIEKHLALS